MSSQRRAATILLLAASLGLPAAAAAQEPIGRAELLDEQPVLVSSGVRVAVDVLVPSFFRGPIGFPDEVEVEGAVVLLQPGASTNLTERIEGSNWAGVRRTYRVYPTSPGDVEIAGLSVTITYALDNGRASEPTPVSIPPLRFEAFVPDAASNLSQFFASESFRLESTRAPDSDSVRVGETLTRTFVMEADNTPGLFLPRLDFSAPDDIAVYPGQPDLSESGGERGSARVARRVESVTYTFEAEGTYELPGVAVNWWDSPADMLRRAEAPALQVTVLPNPELDAAMLEADTTEEAEPRRGRSWVAFLRDNWHWMLGALAVLVAARSVGPACGRWLRGWLAERHARATTSEAAYFREFVATAGQSSAPQVHAALTRWLDRWQDGGGTATLESFAREAGSDELGRQVAGLGRDAYGAGGEWSPQVLVREVQMARRHRQASAEAPHALAPLNPAGRLRGRARQIVAPRLSWSVSFPAQILDNGTLISL